MHKPNKITFFINGVMLLMMLGFCSAAADAQEQPARQVQYEHTLPTQNEPAYRPPVTPRTTDWWHPYVTRTARVNSSPVPLTLESVLVRALQHSSQIRVFSDLPLIRETAIVEADAAFDWYGFLDSRWDDLSDPVGNTLTTGGASRFEDHQAALTYGGRKRTRSGGTLELAQDHGWQRNNSTFFQPNPQATSRLRLSYSHPLLRGRGVEYNKSLIVLAQIDACIANSEFKRQLQSHLLEVIRSYWSLYLERALLVQQLRSFYRAKKTVERLELRRSLDAVDSQIASARAALKTREAEVVRARTNVRNAEARIRGLVNDPAFSLEHNAELIPMDPLDDTVTNLDMSQAMAIAIQHRPEIDQALQQIKSAGTRRQMSRNELLPALNLVTEAYLAGLEPNEQFIGAVREQFSYQPGYSLGLQFEIPLHNRAAKANLQRRTLELRQLKNQYQTTLETLRLEVEIAVRNVETGKPELDAKREALLASQQRLDYLQKRWQHLPGADLSASLALENLLSAQHDLTLAEASFSRSLVTYNLAQSSLLHATGMLLQEEKVHIQRSGGDVPQIFARKIGGRAQFNHMLPTVDNSIPEHEYPGTNNSTEPPMTPTFGADGPSLQPDNAVRESIQSDSQYDAPETVQPPVRRYEESRRAVPGVDDIPAQPDFDNRRAENPIRQTSWEQSRVRRYSISRANSNRRAGSRRAEEDTRREYESRRTPSRQRD